MTEKVSQQRKDSSDSIKAARNLYLDLMKRCLINWIYMDQEKKPANPQMRIEGRDWPENAHTMIGLKRLDNVQFCVEAALSQGIPGDLIETGVWRGGATILMRAILRAYGIQDRTVWVADSFEGLPPPNPEKYPYDTGDVHHLYKELVVSLEQVQANFECYDLLDEQVRFLKGWFSQTLPSAPIEKLAVIRLDGDMYESTMDGLVNLYPKLSPGGYIIIDDYQNIYTPGCRRAVDDYRRKYGITDELVPVSWNAAYWQHTHPNLQQPPEGREKEDSESDDFFSQLKVARQAQSDLAHAHRELFQVRNELEQMRASVLAARQGLEDVRREADLLHHSRG